MTVAFGSLACVCRSLMASLACELEKNKENVLEACDTAWWTHAWKEENTPVTWAVVCCVKRLLGPLI